MKRNLIRLVLLAAFVTFGLAGCGIKGPLYIYRPAPDTADKTPPPPPSPSPAETTAIP